MRTKIAVLAPALVLAAGASAMLAAPGQMPQPGQTTQTPGQMTQARVWVQNRGRGDALPVDLTDVSTAVPLRVQVFNGEPVPGAPTNPVQVRVVQQPRIWDYEMITVKPGQNIAQALSARGAAGWETTGIIFANADGTALVLKRLR
jgi:hypothetical protein